MSAVMLIVMTPRKILADGARQSLSKQTWKSARAPRPRSQPRTPTEEAPSTATDTSAAIEVSDANTSIAATATEAAAIAEAASTPMEISDSAAASAAGSTAAVAAGSPKYLCLIRHGQGEHNPRKNPLAVGFIPKMLMRDAKLTGKGRKQAGALQQPMQWMPFDLIVVSPLSRTIETATAAFEEHPTPKRLCHLMCERATMPADQGTPKAQLLKKHPQLADWQGWDELPEHFWPPRSLKTAEQEVAARVEEFKSWLLARPETCFALVGHSAFFMTMTQMERKLSNCEAFWCLLMPDASIVPAPELPPPPLADHDD